MNLAPRNWLVFVLTFGICGCDVDNHDAGAQVPAAELGPGEHQWRISSLEAEGIDREPFEAMVNLIEDESDIGIDGVVIVYKGALVFEDYFGKWDRKDIHSTRSAAKAITSALVGVAIDQGFLESVDQTVLPFFPEYEGTIENWDERKNDITIGHVLSMTSGVRNNEDNMYPTEDWIKFYWDQPLAADPGEKFSYATSGIVTIGNVVTRASKLRIPAFADKYLFEPMGIKKYRWPITNSRGNQGLAMTGGGLHLTPRDMAKFGLLYLNKGRWNGQRLLSEEWVAESTRKHATSDLYGEDFGYLWRMIDREIDGKPLRSFEAWGNGGQFIMVWPELELVVAWTGENYGKFPEMERPFQLTEQYILPAITKASMSGSSASAATAVP
ncbi:MAG: serine hydrolase [Pseudomonadota bacterium]